MNLRLSKIHRIALFYLGALGALPPFTCIRDFQICFDQDLTRTFLFTKPFFCFDASVHCPVWHSELDLKLNFELRRRHFCSKYLGVLPYTVCRQYILLCLFQLRQCNSKSKTVTVMLNAWNQILQFNSRIGSSPDIPPILLPQKL